METQVEVKGETMTAAPVELLDFLEWEFLSGLQLEIQAALQNASYKIRAWKTGQVDRWANVAVLIVTPSGKYLYKGKLDCDFEYHIPTRTAGRYIAAKLVEGLARVT